MARARRDRYLRGSRLRCPKCASRKVAFAPDLEHAGFGPGLASCVNCRALWEPFDPAQIWDPDDPLRSFREPCNNCAFRPGSDEQRDRVKWRALIAELRQGASFYCHKGVPIEAGAEHGFAYPADRNKLRLCRGYLDALKGLHKRAHPDVSSPARAAGPAPDAARPASPGPADSDLIEETKP